MNQPYIGHYSILYIEGLPSWAGWLLVISWAVTMLATVVSLLTTVGFLTWLCWRLR